MTKSKSRFDKIFILHNKSRLHIKYLSLNQNNYTIYLFTCGYYDVACVYLNPSQDFTIQSFLSLTRLQSHSKLSFPTFMVFHALPILPQVSQPLSSPSFELLPGHGCYNRLVLVACSLISNAVALDMFGFGVILAAASCDLRLGITQIGMLASMPFAGLNWTDFVIIIKSVLVHW